MRAAKTRQSVTFRRRGHHGKSIRNVANDIPFPCHSLSTSTPASNPDDGYMGQARLAGAIAGCLLRHVPAAVLLWSLQALTGSGRNGPLSAIPRHMAVQRQSWWMSCGVLMAGGMPAGALKMQMQNQKCYECHESAATSAGHVVHIAIRTDSEMDDDAPLSGP